MRDENCWETDLSRERGVNVGGETALPFPIFHESEFDAIEARLKVLLVRSVHGNQSLEIHIHASVHIHVNRTGVENGKRGQRNRVIDPTRPTT